MFYSYEKFYFKNYRIWLLRSLLLIKGYVPCLTDFLSYFYFVSLLFKIVFDSLRISQHEPPITLISNLFVSALYPCSLPLKRRGKPSLWSSVLPPSPSLTVVVMLEAVICSIPFCLGWVLLLFCLVTWLGFLAFAVALPFVGFLNIIIVILLGRGSRWRSEDNLWILVSPMVIPRTYVVLIRLRSSGFVAVSLSAELSC